MINCKSSECSLERKLSRPLGKILVSCSVGIQKLLKFGNPENDLLLLFVV